MLNYLYCKHTYTHITKRLQIYPISFSASISRVWRVYRVPKIYFFSPKAASSLPNPNYLSAKQHHFVFLLQQKKVYVNIKCTFLYTTEILDSRMNHRNRTNWLFHIMPFSNLAKILKKALFYIIYHFYIKNNIKNNNYFHKVMILKLLILCNKYMFENGYLNKCKFANWWLFARGTN